MTKSDISSEIIDLLELPDAYKRLKDHLVEAGIQEKSAMFLLGRLASQIQGEVVQEAAKLAEANDIKPSEMSQKELQVKLDEVFEREKGLSLKGYANFLAEQKVREFEALGEK